MAYGLPQEGARPTPEVGLVLLISGEGPGKDRGLTVSAPLMWLIAEESVVGA